MRIAIVTIFPEMFRGFLSHGIVSGDLEAQQDRGVATGRRLGWLGRRRRRVRRGGALRAVRLVAIVSARCAQHRERHDSYDQTSPHTTVSPGPLTR